ncbi:hypothetical protein COM47_30695 [Bacillus wiedmannii]|nr:hypothetical protein CN532_24155 [Bacillus wiedmannii]PGD75878.1 hypothetical protein COM47_30695 [Bacillus wiedmannii]PHA19890.1 hypothetical protein COE59_28945 [Bacillus wiedmannii]
MFKDCINAETILYKDIRKHVFKLTKRKSLEILEKQFISGFTKGVLFKWKINKKHSEITNKLYTLEDTVKGIDRRSLKYN